MSSKYFLTSNFCGVELSQGYNVQAKLKINLAKNWGESTGVTKKLISYSNKGIVPSGEFSVNETFAWVSGTSYDVVVTTDRGSIFKTQVTAPWVVPPHKISWKVLKKLVINETVSRILIKNSFQENC